LKKPTDEKLYQWVSSISGKTFEVAFEAAVSIRWLYSFGLQIIHAGKLFEHVL
jgi:hypothetical protein